MKKLKEKKIFNKHLVFSLGIFFIVILITLTFISFLEDTQKYDKGLRANILKEGSLDKKRY